MDADRYRRVEALFHAALDRPPAERAAFLDEACDDDGLRADVERLLAADADDDLLGDPVLSLPEALAVGPEKGREIGPYRVVRPLGRGGMGEVFLAVREAPFRRTVALKVVRDGGGSAEARARFAVERQVLASLDHAGIARLYDGGVTDDDLPYLAMEVVDGQPVTAYADERRLGVEDRLRLFVQICEAVHYAHQNLVLHRDLKPSNVLVTPEGRVKLLDFGIAKLLDPDRSAVEVPETRTGARLLTPEYASPEQVRGESLSTASDVYSLGVVLYELLTGHRPHRLAGRTTDEMIRTVSETPPTSPSAVVARGPEAGEENGTAADAEVAARRGLTPDRLARRLAGDLDAICLRALRKEPSRRYGSADLLAQDVERHLERRPVRARRGTRRYRLGSFLRRHRVETAAAASVLLALVGGLGAALWQAGEASRERDLARTEAAKAEEVATFLTGLFEQGDPTVAVGDTITVREVLDAAVARIDGLDGQPEVQGALLAVLADAYGNLGRPADARPLAERAYRVRRAALGDNHPETMESRRALGYVYVAAEEHERAVGLFRASLADAQRLHGDASPVALIAYDDLANALHLAGRADEAARIRDRWAALVASAADLDDPLLAQALARYARVLMVQREFAGAERFLRRAAEVERRSLEGGGGAAHPTDDLGQYLRLLAEALWLEEKYVEAEATARDALAVLERLHPDGHEEVAVAGLQLARCLQSQQRYAEADQAFRVYLAMLRRLTPDGDPVIPLTLQTMAQMEVERGRLDVAERWQRAAVEAFEQAEGPDYLPAVFYRLNLADILVQRGSFPEAEPLLLHALRLARRPNAALFFSESRVRAQLAALYETWGQPAEAARYRPRVHAEGEGLER